MMRFGELYDLAKHSLMSRKKNTRLTVFGFVFGMVIIIPLLMILFGLNIGITDKLSDNMGDSNFVIIMTDYREEYDDIKGVQGNNGLEVSGRLSGNLHIDELISYSKYNTYTVFEQYNILNWTSGDVKPFLYVDGKGVETKGGTENVTNVYINVIDMDKKESFFPASTMKRENSIYVEGFDNGFKENTLKQVVISERFLKEHNIKGEDIYDKVISINTGVDKDRYFCINYKVVGILKNDVTGSQKDSDTFYKADFYFLSYDMYDDENNRIITYGAEENIVEAHPDSLNINSVFGVSEDNTSTYIRFESSRFNDLVGLNEYIEDRYSPMLLNGFGVKSTSAYYMMRELFNIYNILMSVFLVIAVIVIIIVLLNLFITVFHNIDYKSQYLAMLESIGMTDKDVVRLYMTENFIIATRAAIIITVISLITGIILRIASSVLLKDVLKISMTIIPVWSILLALVLGLVFIYLSTLSIAYICANNFTKKGIVDILNSKNQN